MDLGRIYQIKDSLQHEDMSLNEIIEVQDAFEALVAAGAKLRDQKENALVSDMLEELEEHATTVEKVIVKWITDNFGGAEAANPAYSTKALAAEINKIEVILGSEEGTLGKLLGET